MERETGERAGVVGRSPNALNSAVRCSNEERMARLEEETSNALFETLEDWEAQLKQADQELRTLKRDTRGPSL